MYIKTDIKFDVNRLTEHQKETLKKKREDIPALYNDLSQSSSQNSQNLQQWFDIKAKHINESTDKAGSKKNESTAQKPIDNEANKENKIATERTEYPNALDKIVDHIYCSKLDESVAKQDDDLNNKAEKDNPDGKRENDAAKQTASPGEQCIATETSDETDTGDPVVSVVVAKKLNFESHEEFPEDKAQERQSSPSMLDSAKRRHRNSSTKLSSPPKSEKTAENQREASGTNAQRTLRAKIAQGKSDATEKTGSSDDVDMKEDASENKRGVKRKHAPDAEADSAMQRRKRKLISSSKTSTDDDAEPSRGSNVFSDIDMDSVSQRTRNEISRLKIDMVFDCHSVNRRRVKHGDENEKEITVHGSRKHGVPDAKSGLKPKSVEVKSAEAAKRSSKPEKEKEKATKEMKDTRDVDDADQGMSKRRSRKCMKPESDKCDSDINRDVRKPGSSTERASEPRGSADAETMRAQAVQTVDADTSGTNPDENREDESSELESSELVETSKQSQDEVEEVIESSQTPNVSLKLDKKCGEKQCFIKINKMTNVQAARLSDTTVDKNYVPESTSMEYGDADVTDPCDKAKNNAELVDEENKDDANKDSTQEADNSDVKIVAPPDCQKVLDSSSSVKSAGIVNFTSPKSSTKILSKSKPFTGRAAHMLGLVTKQSRIDDDSPIVVHEDELPPKKLKAKETENETTTSKKVSVVKEIDKIGGPSGSRQEKIFSNMRSAATSMDYYASSSMNTFATLKNDGEKLSFRLDKIGAFDYAPMETSVDKENEGIASPMRERDNLPILEWSSANPPSLTASPSASILKRHRSNPPESDLAESVTPNKVLSVQSKPGI